MCKAKTVSGHTCKKSRGMDRCWSHAHTCSICLEKVGDDSSKLSCNHWFHASCIYKWLDRDSRCPMCRKDIKERMNITINYDDDADLPDEATIIESLRSLHARQLIRDEVWIRRAFVIYNQDGVLVAALDQI
jgi:Ring finger domain